MVAQLREMSIEKNERIEEDNELFPIRMMDQNDQQIDLRQSNSWTMTLDEAKKNFKNNVDFESH